jgi:hypothetical protein
MDMNQSYCSFWPKPAHDIHLSILDVMPEQTFAGQATFVTAGNRLRLLANCVHTTAALELEGNLIDPFLHEAAREILAVAKECSPEDREQLHRVAQYVRGRFNDRELLSDCAKYVEQEVFLFFGPLATWYTKTKERRISFVMGRPDSELRGFVSRVVNEDALTSLVREVSKDQRFALSSKPDICFIDLVFCGGESDLFPKHYAYFLPEHAGYLRSATKKTVVFGNVHCDKFDQISCDIGRQFVHNFCVEASRNQIRRALSVWIRAHDLGHSVLHADTNWRRFSQRDYFWSMACQELWADLIGYSFALHPRTIDAVGLTRNAMTDVLLAEMLRYAAGGPLASPDSMSANWELAWLFDSGAVRVVDGLLSANWETFFDAIKALLVLVARVCLGGDAQAMLSLTKELTPRREMARAIEGAGKVERFQVYSTSL